MNATEMDTPDTCELGIGGLGSDSRLDGDQFQGTLDLLTKDAGRLRAIGGPSYGRFCDLVRRTSDDSDGELAVQPWP